MCIYKNIGNTYEISKFFTLRYKKTQETLTKPMNSKFYGNKNARVGNIDFCS